MSEDVVTAIPHLVRDATPDDAAACAAIYAPYVDQTAISFEARPPTADEFAERMRVAQLAHAWLVAEVDGEVGGYAYAGRFAEREAYRWSCTVTVYCRSGLHRSGLGRSLYSALLERLVERGYRTAVGLITLPNAASIGLHRSMGFEQVGVHQRIGFKHGAWHDVALFQRALVDDDSTPRDPV